MGRARKINPDYFPPLYEKPIGYYESIFNVLLGRIRDRRIAPYYTSLAQDKHSSGFLYRS